MLLGSKGGSPGSLPSGSLQGAAEELLLTGVCKVGVLRTQVGGKGVCVGEMQVNDGGGH